MSKTIFFYFFWKLSSQRQFLGPKWPIFEVFGPKFPKFRVYITITEIIGRNPVRLIMPYEHSKFSQKNYTRIGYFRPKWPIFRVLGPKFPKFWVYTTITGIIECPRVHLILPYKHSKSWQKITLATAIFRLRMAYFWYFWPKIPKILRLYLYSRDNIV